MKTDQIIEDSNELRELKKAIQKVEISLKKDLGVYIVEFNDGERKMKLNPDYRDIPSEVEVIR